MDDNLREKAKLNFLEDRILEIERERTNRISLSVRTDWSVFYMRIKSQPMRKEWRAGFPEPPADPVMTEGSGGRKSLVVKSPNSWHFL